MELKELLVFGENMILVRHDEIPDKFKDLSCNILANFMNHLSDCLKYDNPVLNSKKSVDILNVVLGLPFPQLFKHKSENDDGPFYCINSIKNTFLCVLVNSELKKKRKLTANSSSNAENSSSDPNKAEKQRKINTNLLDKIADVIAKFDNKFGVADSDIEALTHFNDKLKPDLMEALHVFTHQKNVIFEPSAYCLDKLISTFENTNQPEFTDGLVGASDLFHKIEKYENLTNSLELHLPYGNNKLNFADRMDQLTETQIDRIYRAKIKLTYMMITTRLNYETKRSIELSSRFKNKTISIRNGSEPKIRNNQRIVEKIEWIQHTEQIKIRITTCDNIGIWQLLFASKNEKNNLIFRTAKGEYELILHDRIELEYKHFINRALTRNLILYLKPRSEKKWPSLTEGVNSKVVPWFDLFSEGDS